MKGDWRICLDILAVVLLLLVTVDQTNCQDDDTLSESVSCGEGFFEHMLQQDDPYFSHVLLNNQKGSPPAAWQLGIEGSNAHLSLRGKDSYVIKKINEDPFLLLQACCQTKGVRNVQFNIKVPGIDNPIDYKVVKETKSEYTESCLDVPDTGIMVKSVRFRFRTSKGKMEGDKQQNDFKVRDLFISGCIPNSERLANEV